MTRPSRHSVPTMSFYQPRVARQYALFRDKDQNCCPDLAFFLLCVFFAAFAALREIEPHHSKASLDFVRIQNNNYEHQFNTNSMSWFHLIFGFLMFVVFVTTGKYMRADFPDKDAIRPELRLLMRSRHIYILFSSLIHLALGVYLTIRPQTWQRVMQYTGSFFLILSSGLLLWAFITETYELAHFSDISRYGIYTSLAGVGFHLIGGLSVSRAR